MLTTQTIGNRYVLLAEIGRGGMGAVYQAHDRLTGQDVALKQVSLAHAMTDDQTNLVHYALAQEFKVLASLRHPHIISVLDYGFDQNRDPYFTLELLQQGQTFVAYGQDKPLEQQVELLIQVLQALIYLHQRGIVHRDLKPDNVMILNDQVKVLDFGLAVAREHLSPSGSPAGTLSYMAPETFAGTPGSVTADLYAVGVMMYQLLTGHLPFVGNNKYALMYKIARVEPDYSEIVGHPLCDVVKRLLQKHPSDRYKTAVDVITALCAAIDYPGLLESHAVRESFLQAAHFVGRETEFATLRDALDKAREGQGSAWLVSGESGVGKSRLLDELRTQALVDGGLVLRGQAIAEGSLPYQMWREALRWLTLQIDLSDFSASVIKPLVPDIAALLGHDVPDSPVIDVHSLQIRLLAVIEGMFRQQQNLTVLLLEDLQWADDSLMLMRRLSELSTHQPLLIVGTYRDDERPTLADELPTFQHIRLERLSPDSIEALSVSMLGEVGKSQSVIELLQRETEGNVFFIVEVVRALAEEVGQLSDIGSKTLPEHVFAGGIQTVVQRRLNMVPESAHRLMTIAAVGGREIDLRVLQALMPDLNLDDWLQKVATVIEALDSRYRFAHDKLRDGILSTLPLDDRRRIHRDLAQAIETVYPDSPEQYVSLAYHWEQGQDAPKTIRYATLAGQQALRAGSFREAVQFFQQALALTSQVSLDSRTLSQLHYLIGDAHWGQSNMLQSREAHLKALSLLGFSIPLSRGQLMLGAVKPLLKHLGRQALGIEGRAHNPEELLIAAQSFSQISQGAYHDANFALGLYCIFRAIDAAECAGGSFQAKRVQARNYASLGFAMGDIRLHRIASFYIKRAEGCLDNEPDPETQAWIDFIHGIYVAGHGEWDQCNHLLDKSARMSASAGSLRLWGEASEFKVYALMLQSRFSEAMSLLEAAMQVAARDGYILTVGRAHITKSTLLRLQGKTREAMSYYQAHESAIESALITGDQTVSKIFVQGLLITLHLRDENWDAALKSAESLTALIDKAQTISFLLVDHAASPALVYLTLWEKQADISYRPLAQVMLTTFHRKYTRYYVIGEALEAAYRCWYAWLDGQEKQARAFGEQAIRAAQASQMPYYEAIARYHLGRFMSHDDPERAEHLTRAITLFDQVGAVYDAEQTRLLMGTSV